MDKDLLLQNEISTETEAFAEETEVTTKVELPEVVVSIPDTITVYQANEDDYNFNEVSTYATSSVYDGTYNSTIVSLWKDLLENNVGKDYLGYRSGQYTYVIYFGDVDYDNGIFSGNGDYYYLNTNTYNSGYQYTHGTGDFTVDASNNYVYTNVCNYYPALQGERGLLYDQIQSIGIIAVIGFLLLRWIFGKC